MFDTLLLLLVIGVCIVLAVLIYHFLGIFVKDNKKRVVITVIIALLSIAIYFYEDNKHVVYMKEDTIYIKPAPNYDTL